MRRGKLATPRPLEVEPSLADILRFLAKVKQEGDCWIWQGRKDENGYGQFKYKGQAIGAHRFAEAVFNGAIPARRHVHHKHECPSHACVAPHHVEATTVHKNCKDGGHRRQARPAREPAPF